MTTVLSYRASVFSTCQSFSRSFSRDLQWFHIQVIKEQVAARHLCSRMPRSYAVDIRDQTQYPPSGWEKGPIFMSPEKLLHWLGKSQY